MYKESRKTLRFIRLSRSFLQICIEFGMKIQLMNVMKCATFIVIDSGIQILSGEYSHRTISLLFFGVQSDIYRPNHLCHPHKHLVIGLQTVAYVVTNNSVGTLSCLAKIKKKQNQTKMQPLQYTDILYP